MIRLRPKPRVRRIAEYLRRVERREIRTERIVRILERCPRGIHHECGEDDEDDEWLKPPRISPHRFTKATMQKRERVRHRGRVRSRGKGSRTERAGNGPRTTRIVNIAATCFAATARMRMEARPLAPRRSL